MTFTGISIWTITALIAGSAVLLAVLHRLRIRPQTVWVNTTLFWDQALRRTRARSLWERFRHPLTYLLLLLIALLLIVALGNPRPSLDSRNREHSVFVLDLSSSMSVASADDQTRLTEAKEKLITLADQFPWPDGFAVVVAGPEPRLIHAMGDLRPMLEHRLESIEAASTPTDRDHAVRLAASLLEGRERPSVCLITDRPFYTSHESQKNDRKASDDEESVPPCKVVQVGKPVSNAAILSTIFEPDQKNQLAGTLRVRAGVWPQGKATVKIAVRRDGGPLLAEKEVTLTEAKKTTGSTAESTIELAVEQLAADGGTILVEITGDDVLRADSVVRYRLPVRKPIRLLVEKNVPNWLTVLMEIDPTLVRSKSSDADVKLRVAASKPLPEPYQVVEVRAATRQADITSLDDQAVTFEDLYCTAAIPRDHFDASITPMVTAGEHLIVASQPTAPCPTLWLADIAWSNDATVIRSPAWPIVVRRAIRELADWQASPISLDPLAANHMPELADATLATMPGSREMSNLTAVEENKNPSEPTSLFIAGQSAWVEWLLLAAFVLAVLEIVLHTKGKIA